MFIRRSTYEGLLNRNIQLSQQLIDLTDEWNELVGKVNNRGLGFNEQFDENELKLLRRLCHPDKHGGSTLSKTVTIKLNKLIENNT